MQLTRESAEKIMSDMFMSDMPLVEFQPRPALVSSDWFAQYKKLCREFMRSLVDAVETLSFMNLTQEEFMALVAGHTLPANTSIRFRVPLVWGGTLDVDNLFMCRTFPCANNLDRFLITQSGAQTIYLPSPAQRVYVPAHTASGGDGGNATSDRLAQMAAQIAAARGME